MTSASSASFQPISPASWHPNPGPPKPEATPANEGGPRETDRPPAYGGGEARLRVSKQRRARARGCGAARAGVGGHAGRQVSAASAFGGDGAAPGSCGRPLALAPRPQPLPPPPPAAAADLPGPGPAGRAAAALRAAVALDRPRRGELGAARGRARGPVSPRRPLAPQRPRGGRRLRRGPRLGGQADQQHAPGEWEQGPCAAGVAGRRRRRGWGVKGGWRLLQLLPARLEAPWPRPQRTPAPSPGSRNCGGRSRAGERPPARRGCVSSQGRNRRLLRRSFPPGVVKTP